MTDTQAKEIRELRIKGIGYRSISYVVGLSRDIVRNYCKAKGLDGYASMLSLEQKEKMQRNQVCFNCEKKIHQPTTGRPKKFCSDKCRREWWKSHKEALIKKESATYHLNCSYCDLEFVSYGNKKRKYCSHNCYIKDRFWRDES